MGKVESGTFYARTLQQGTRSDNGLFEAGSFLHGKLNGPNFLRILPPDAHGHNVSLTGTFKLGDFTFGILTSTDGTLERGSFFNNSLQDQHGYRHSADNITYEGAFRKGHFVSGRKTLPSGTVEIGQFLNNLLQGIQNTRLSASGVNETGSFEKGQLASGKKELPDGLSFYGRFHDGSLEAPGIIKVKGVPFLALTDNKHTALALIPLQILLALVLMKVSAPKIRQGLYNITKPLRDYRDRFKVQSRVSLLQAQLSPNERILIHGEAPRNTPLSRTVSTWMDSTGRLYVPNVENTLSEITCPISLGSITLRGSSLAHPPDEPNTALHIFGTDDLREAQRNSYPCGICRDPLAPVRAYRYFADSEESQINISNIVSTVTIFTEGTVDRRDVILPDSDFSTLQ